MPVQMDLSGKVAIVTGASRGIGQSIAEYFAEAGAKVVLASRKQADLDEAAAAIKAKGGEAMAMAAHTGEKATLKALVDKTLETYGKVDILVNNAGIAKNTPAESTPDEEWLNIINIASVNGIRPGTMQGVYSASKAAVISLTQTLAVELGKDNIRVNAIAPGLIQTKFAKVLWENDALLKQVEARTPIGRIGQPNEIASLALWLASDLSSFATGETFVVDGGLTIPAL